MMAVTEHRWREERFCYYSSQQLRFLRRVLSTVQISPALLPPTAEAAPNHPTAACTRRNPAAAAGDAQEQGVGRPEFKARTLPHPDPGQGSASAQPQLPAEHRALGCTWGHLRPQTQALFLLGQAQSVLALLQVGCNPCTRLSSLTQAAGEKRKQEQHRAFGNQLLGWF